MVTAVEADRFSWRRLGSIPGCVALGCADIGEARVNGERVYVTWGRNLTADEQEAYRRNTIFVPIHLGADDGSAELILPDSMAAKLITLL